MLRSAAREITFDDNTDLDLDLDLDLTPRERLRFVTGAVAAGGVGVPCRFCGRLGKGPTCDSCGAPISASEDVPPSRPGYPIALREAVSVPAVPSVPKDAGALRASIEGLPIGFWKRVPAYTLLAMALGNGCLCSGLSGWMNGTLGVLALVGLFGFWVASQNQP